MASVHLVVLHVSGGLVAVGGGGTGGGGAAGPPVPPAATSLTLLGLLGLQRQRPLVMIGQPDTECVGNVRAPACTCT